MSLLRERRNIAILLGGLLVLAIVIFAVTRGLGDDGPSGDAVAVVDGDEISAEEFDRALEQAAKRQGPNAEVPEPGDPQYEQLRNEALGDLLDAAWILGEADERGIEASDREVEEQLEQTKNESFKNEQEYQRFLERSGFTEEDVTLRVQLQVLSQKIQQEISDQTPEVSEEEAREYYEANLDTFGQPEQRNLRLVQNEDEAKVEQALTELEQDDSPAAWKRVAAEFSADPSSKGNGGVRESVTEGTLPPPLEEAVFDADKGELVGPIETPDGSYVVQVEEITEASTQPFEEIGPQIQEQLSSQRGQEVFTAFIGDYRDKWTVLTICAEDFRFERCKNFPPVAQPLCTPEQADSTGCPAVVTLVSPAAPGSILPFVTATGTPQRPHPAGEDSAEPAIPEGIPGAPPGTTVPPPGG